MKPEENYLKINKESWNIRTDFHMKSDFYDLEGFLDGKSSLKEIELDLLGDLSGKSVLHLQCHFGQDTISLERLGAKMTGVDFSDKAIKRAIEIGIQTQSNASFICCDVYDLPNHLTEQFDMIFTSYGVINWLPDLDKWAAIISNFLKPNGKLVLVEFHPFVWMFDDNFHKIDYSYFNVEPIVEQESGTYADKSADITLEYVYWNHNLGEVVNSLIKSGLEINLLKEYDYSPYDCFQQAVEFESQKYRIKHLGQKIPMVYAIVATRI